MPGRTLFFYILRQLLGPFFVTVLSLTFIFLMTQMLDLADYVVNYKVGLGTVGLLLFYSWPFFLTFVVPMATMLAVLLTFLRMSTDNEIVALKAGGVSLWALLPPVVVFSLLAALLTGVMTVHGLVWGRVSMKSLVAQVAKQNVEIGLKERTFNTRFPNVVLYVGEMDPATRRLSDVFIEDRRQAGATAIIVAEKGQLLADPKKAAWVLRLEDVTINQVDNAQRTVHSGRHGSYEFRLNLEKALAQAPSNRPKDEEEMTLAELKEFIAQRGLEKKDDLYWLALLQWHKKFAIPLACLVLGFCGMPLGIVSKRAKSSFGVGLGLVFFLLYYLLLAAGEVFGEAGTYPPAIGMWLPNLVCAAVGFLLFQGALRDRPLAPVAWMQAALWRRSEKRNRAQAGKAGG